LAGCRRAGLTSKSLLGRRATLELNRARVDMDKALDAAHGPRVAALSLLNLGQRRLDSTPPPPPRSSAAAGLPTMTRP
jgi:hypothetical protein